MESILEESRKAKGLGGKFKKRSKKIVLVAIILLLTAGSAYAYFSKSDSNKQVVTQTKNWQVKKDNLLLSVESEGQVVAEDGVELSFSVSGDILEVLDVFVKEGDKVKKGDKIASVKTEALELSLQNSYASYQSALASYNEKISGPTNEEIEAKKLSISQAEISLNQSEISLAKVKTSAKEKVRSAEQALSDAEDNLNLNQSEVDSEDVKEAYEDLANTIKPVIMSVENILLDSDKILGIDNMAEDPDLVMVLGAKDKITLNNAKNSYIDAKGLQDDLSYYNLSLSQYSDYRDIESAYSLTADTLEKLESHLYYLQKTLEATVASAEVPENEISSYKSTIVSNRNTVSSKISSLNNAYRAVNDAKDRLDDYVTEYNDAKNNLEIAKEESEQDIATAESSLEAKKLSLEQTKTDYNNLFNEISASELAAAKSQLTSATTNLNKAKLELDKATLYSPIDGEIALLNYKAGDIIMTSENKPVAVIINNNTLFIEANIEEADISKLKVGQKAYITFDALDELKIEGEVSFMSLTSETSNNGIVTYLVKVLFNKEDYPIREGMTAYVDFVISETEDVLTVPVSAIKNINGSPSVQLLNGEWQAVSSGFTDGKYVEIISGLNQGDIVVY
ncbi:MAG: efflux RND transporter periplasmic adaptor subunit [Candidatus Pacebacteria bacterium]|nr:efflux RND transporter periplasmic adaptor subunit [Candidatus Paceibacterota bacterium]